MDENTLNWLLEHHQESYRYQLEQKEKLQDRVAFLSSPLTLLGGGIIYLATHYAGDSNFCYVYWFYSAIAFAVISFLTSLSQIMYPVFWRFRYYSILSPRKLQDYANKLIDHAARVDGVDVLPRIKQKLIDRYSDAATRNWEINYRRSNFISRGMKICLFCFAFFLVALIPFFRSTLDQPTRPTNVIISNPVRITR